VEFPAVGDSLLRRRFLEQSLVGVAERAVEDVDVSGGVGSFRIPRRDYGTSSVYHVICRLRAVPVLAAKLTNQGEKYGFSPF
jgi:hypothetical protein